MRMEQLDERRDAAGPSPVLARLACVAVGLAVVAAAAVVVALRVTNGGPEPEGQNWWLVAWLVVGLADAVTGVALLSRPRRRLLGTAFVVVGAAAALTAVSIQYGGAHPTAQLADTATWSRPLFAGMLAGVVPWLVRGGGGRLVRAAETVAVAAVVTSTLVAAAGGPRWLHDLAAWTVAASATGAAVRLAVMSHHARRDGDDPLPPWLVAGSVAAWLAVVPETVGHGGWVPTDSDVVAALLVLATIPLLAGGAVVDAIRDTSSSSSPFLGLSHRGLEWAVLATGVVGVYTALVAGLGRLLGGSGPTWLLVAATGVIALALEPARQRVRRFVDRLVYGARDDPLTVVQRIVDHLDAGAGEDLLPALVASLQSELRLDAVAIDLRVDGGWRGGASVGPPTSHQRVVPLTHRGEVAGRLLIGWQDGSPLRERDERILEQVAGPLSLAVGWVRLADDLRRSSVAIVSAREEERRRLRRDLHDGLGPSLTGVSLGLRTAVRQLGRAVDPAAVAPTNQLLERVADEVDTAVAELKRIVRDLRPTALDQLGLVGAVAEFTRGLDDTLQIHLALPAQPLELPAAVEVATYRIVTEAVTNVVRHARAASCWLTIAAGPSVVIDVVDDGVGIGAGERRGVGLTAMHERAAELGGSVRLLPNRPRGTRVHVMLPAALP
jgi:two-component system NarL family sensor kinase